MCQICNRESHILWATFLVAIINAINHLIPKRDNQERPMMIAFTSTNSDKVSWITQTVEAKVILLSALKAYLGTSPLAFTNLP